MKCNCQDCLYKRCLAMYKGGITFVDTESVDYQRNKILEKMIENKFEYRQLENELKELYANDKEIEKDYCSK